MFWVFVLLLCVGRTAQSQAGLVEAKHEEFFRRLPSRRLHQSFSYYAPQETNGVASLYGSTSPSYGTLTGYPSVAETLHQSQISGSLSVNGLAQVNGIPSTGFQTAAGTAAATGFITPTTARDPTTVQAQGILPISEDIHYPPGVHKLAAAPLMQQLEAAGLSKETVHQEKSAKKVEGLQFLQGVKAGLKQKRAYRREAFLEELNRSPSNDVGQITIQQATNYAYQHGDDVVNIGSTRGAQKILGPSPSTLTPEQLFQSGFQQGLNQGALSTAQTGFNAGFAGGFLQGFQNGFQQGLNQGVSGVVARVPEATSDPSYLQGFEDGIQVGLNQGVLAALEFQEKLQRQDSSENRKTGEISTTTVGQEEMNKLAEDALLNYLQDLLENEDGSNAEEAMADSQGDISSINMPSQSPSDDQVEGNRSQVQTQSLESQKESDSDLKAEPPLDAPGEAPPGDRTTDMQEVQGSSDSVASSSFLMNETTGGIGAEKQVIEIGAAVQDTGAFEVIDLVVLEALRIAGTSQNSSLNEVQLRNLGREGHSQIIELTIDALSRAGLGDIPLSITEVNQEDIYTAAETISLDANLVAQIEEILRYGTGVEPKSTGNSLWVVVEDTQEPPVFINTLLQNEDSGDELQALHSGAEKSTKQETKEQDMSSKSYTQKRFSRWHLYGAGIAVGAAVIIGVFWYIFYKKARAK